MPRRRAEREAESHANGDSPLLRAKEPIQYNQDEQQFSMLLHDRLDELLRGGRNELMLIRKYIQDPRRLGVMETPSGLRREALRLPVIARMLTDTLAFMHDGDPGSAIARRADGDRTIDVQEFATKWPHIILVRSDVFDAEDGTALEITWCARRMQNSRASIRVNRLFDIANLGVEVVRMIGLGR
ncbi:MAG: hypothetical protein M0Z94_13665 [Dehalococcoidales bacterium]|nr:hypothetical protein [Dehalococcoidales bacterium]